ncbi:MAG: hypothetical protein HOP33_22635 [Verrucomicrobia bacterium]|nr:hypothetical protein [Verrucomicrobiota bacterium]
MDDSIFQSLAAAATADSPVALSIITGAKGSSPQKIGAKALFFADRSIKGTLGGGCLEAEVQRLALLSLRDGKPRTFELVLDHDFGWDDGLICGGKVLGVVIPNAQRAGETFWTGLTERKEAKTWCVTNSFEIAPVNGVSRPTSDFLYLETITPPCVLWIAGSGHIAQAVAPLALQLDFAVSVFDDRPELTNYNHFPGPVSIHVGNWGEILTVPLPGSPSFGLIVTRGHNHDALVLESWIHRPFEFLGMIGSARKWRIISDKFLTGKLATQEEMTRVACPVGVRIGSKSVPEIAVSIMAQFIEKRAARVARNQI